ncbi:MAG: hypothetical protein JWQ15_943 [Marmoricola sp.]|nr:hypothetical protein [Marmoricola sp.]
MDASFVVTGGRHGIGAAVAQSLAPAGPVVVNALRGRLPVEPQARG